jgi:hypothetical protein
MSAHRIDVFNFEFWDGSPPVLTYEQGSSFTRPGADGVGQQTLGRWAEPFDATLTAWYASYTLALLAVPRMQAIVRIGPVRLWYNAIDYRTVFGHDYLVDAVEMINCQSVIRLLGPGINLAGGAELLVRFTMTPHYRL